MELQIEEKTPKVIALNETVTAGDRDAAKDSKFQDLRKRVLKASGIAEVCLERLRLLTESYKETEAEPMIIRRAKAFRKILTEIPVAIENWQKVVGNYASKPLMTSIYPEYTAAWILEEMDDLATREGDKFILTQSDKKYLKEIVPYWLGKTVEDAVNNMVPDSVRDAEKNALISSAVKNEGIGQFLPDYEIVLHRGISGIIEDLRKVKENTEPTTGDYLNRMLFYDAALICCEAVIAYSQRFSNHARDLAGKEKDLVRRDELLFISEICERVPANPARTFLEALQSFWFTHLLMYIEAGGQGITMGRFDQYMYPYYKKDLESGRLTRETAKEWLKSCWVNLNQLLTFYPKKTAMIWAGHPMAQQPELGGVKANGTDATNDLSDLILDVEAEVCLHQPDIGIIYHKNMKDNFLLKACKLLPLAGKPKFFNYDVSVKQLLGKGATADEAKRDGAFVGCVEPNLIGKSWGPNNCGFLSLSKCLELALHNGISPLSGDQVSPETGNPEDFTTFDEFINAVKEQIKYGIKQHMILNHAIEIAHRELVPLPFQSLTVHGCIEKGMDLTAGGAYLNKPAIEGVGLANVADSLMVIKKLVYDEKSLSMRDLLDALNNNYEGKEPLRQKLRNAIPKYGNDIDEVDNLAREVALVYCRETEKYYCQRGVTYCAGLYSVSSHGGMGLGVGATPDGRKSGEPLSDGLSPSQGVCKNGPTAVIKSVCKIDHVAAANGTLLNMKFPSEALSDETLLSKFGSLLRTFMSLGGYHVQFNVVDMATLKDAQKNPEKYPELLVRVAAYVALFSQLPKVLQDDIISRSEIMI